MYSRIVPRVRPVVLSGGVGTRLWPLSTSGLPKQFTEILPGASLFEQTLRRLEGIDGVVDPLVVTGSQLADTSDQLTRKIGWQSHLVIVEPEPRNTAPAALVAASLADPKDILVILPSDHLVEDVDGFAGAINTAISMASTAIVTFGVPPTRPETGFGYIEAGEPVGDGYSVSRFKEKPSAPEARKYRICEAIRGGPSPGQ